MQSREWYISYQHTIISREKRTEMKLSRVVLSFVENWEIDSWLLVTVPICAIHSTSPPSLWKQLLTCFLTRLCNIEFTMSTPGLVRAVMRAGAYTLRGSLLGLPRAWVQHTICLLIPAWHSPTGRSRSSKENLGAAGHVVVTLFFEWSAQSVWLCVILISYINLIVR